MQSARPSDPVVHHEHLDTTRAFAELFGQVDDPPATTTATTAQPPNEFRQEREAPEVGQRLRELRDNFNPTTIRKSSKAHGTFNKHQNNQERFILYLYQNSPAYVTQELRQSLDDISAEIDNSTVKARHRRYARTGGKKSLQQRKEDYHIDLLRTEISSFLGEPGTAPPRQVIHFEALEGNVDAFMNFITAMRKENGGLMKSGSYASLRSSFTYLFRRYRYTPS